MFAAGSFVGAAAIANGEKIVSNAIGKTSNSRKLLNLML
jgi:hypothetical protein